MRVTLSAAIALGTQAGCWGAGHPQAPEPLVLTANPSGIQHLNPLILTNRVSNRLVIEVDWVEGGRPNAEALTGLQQVLESVCPPDKRIEVRVDDEIPLALWEQVRELERGWDRLAASVLDDVPPGEEAVRVHVLYVPHGDGWFEPGLYGRHETRGSVETILIFFEQVRRGAAMWITARKIERATLTHEFGHVLGLVSNPGHAQRVHPSHCTRAKCVMHQPGFGSSLRNAPAALFTGKIPVDYCARCRKDLARGAAFWRRRFDLGAGGDDVPGPEGEKTPEPPDSPR